MRQQQGWHDMQSSMEPTSDCRAAWRSRLPGCLLLPPGSRSRLCGSQTQQGSTAMRTTACSWQRCFRKSLLACRLLCSRTGRLLALPSRVTIACHSRRCCLPAAAWLSRQVTITTDTTQECTSSLLPITYPKFPAMCEVRTCCAAVLSCCCSRAADARYVPAVLLPPCCCCCYDGGCGGGGAVCAAGMPCGCRCRDR